MCLQDYRIGTRIRAYRTEIFEYSPGLYTVPRNPRRVGIILSPPLAFATRPELYWPSNGEIYQIARYPSGTANTGPPILLLKDIGDIIRGELAYYGDAAVPTHIVELVLDPDIEREMEQ